MDESERILKNRQWQKKYYQKNKEQRLLQIQKWKKNNPKNQKIYDKKYRQTHKEKIAQSQKQYNKRKIKFKGKSMILDHEPRIGICSNCGKEGQTNLHHTKYDSNNPLKHTRELCVGCHRLVHLDKIIIMAN